VTTSPHKTAAQRPSLPGNRAALTRRPLHKQVSALGAGALSLLFHGVLLTSWLGSRPAPHVQLPPSNASHSAVRVAHTIVHITQLPAPVQHTIIDDPPPEPDDAPLLNVLPPVHTQRPNQANRDIPDIAWFESEQAAMAAFTIRARRPPHQEVSDAQDAPSHEAAPSELAELSEPTVAEPLVAVATPEPLLPEDVTSPAPAAPSTESAQITSPSPASDNRPPRYPGAARRRGWEGRVVMHVLVDEFGAVSKVTVSQSSGRALLDQAALEAVSEWTFAPAFDGSGPVPGDTDVSVRFELDG
jgi:protein TonB